jgi:hypothetical protein
MCWCSRACSPSFRQEKSPERSGLRALLAR